MSEPAPPVGLAELDPLRAGQDALKRHAWPEAFELLSKADREGVLSGSDLESLAEAAFFGAHADAEIEVKERAFKAYLADGDTLRAAYLALMLATRYGFEGKASISSAWTRRGERLLEGMDETYVHGYLALLRSDGAKAAGNIEEALAFAEEAVRIGAHAGNADLQAFALTGLGAIKIATGATNDGFALMEEASISAVNGELSPYASGVACCQMISACRDLTDYRRASEWTEATERYCERQSVSAFPGICRVHRAEVVAVGGAWERAEHELEQAAGELAAYNAIPPMADAYYALGDIRRLKGDLEGAEAALREAHGHGRAPQPALALIRLAQGKVKAAATSINAAVREEGWDQWARVRLLPAQVEIAIAAGDLDLARTAADELARIVDTYATPAMQAAKHQTFGRVLMVEGDAAGAIHELRGAIRDWREVKAPYEVARSRALLSTALRAVDDDEEADLELQTALAEFERLGAKLALAGAQRELRAVADRRDRPVQIRKTFMFTDIVGSTEIAELVGNQAWEGLLRQHDDTVRALVAQAGGAIVNSTGDGFFVAFDTAGQGIACARSIQRTLAESRDSGGSKLWVRIGLHTSAASRRGEDYSGVGVHLAARVAAQAGAGEILATAATLTEAGDLGSTDLRETSLKGVKDPVSLGTVAWT